MASNIYYRALKDTPLRWLDLRKLAETLFPQDTVHRVCYFTARLDARPSNPGQAQRQLIYLRALSMLPRFEVYYGAFRSGIKRRPLADPMPGLPTHVLVRDSEEKGSDVNLATRLLVDGFNERVRAGCGGLQRRGLRQRPCGTLGDELRLRVARSSILTPRNASPRDLARRCDIRQAPLEESFAAEPASRARLTDEVGSTSPSPPVGDGPTIRWRPVGTG